jgi:hypothetical protein
LELYDEARAICRMFVDRRYRRTWTCWLVLPILACLFLFSWLVLGNLFLVGWLLSKLVDMVLVVLGYKILSREAQRYLETVPPFIPPRRQ